MLSEKSKFGAGGIEDRKLLGPDRRFSWLAQDYTSAIAVASEMVASTPGAAKVDDLAAETQHAARLSKIRQLQAPLDVEFPKIVDTVPPFPSSGSYRGTGFRHWQELWKYESMAAAAEHAGENARKIFVEIKP